MDSKKERDCSPNLLLISGMLLLVFGSLGRYTYTTVMSEIIAYRGYAKAEAGIVTACLFFCYAIAQLIAAKFYKKLPVRSLSVVCGISAIINFFMPFASLPVMASLWAVNGIVTSVTYMIVVELFSLYLPKEKRMKSGVWLSLGTPATKLVLFGFAAVGTAYLNWKWTFWASAVILTIVAIYWYWFIGYYHKNSIRGEQTESMQAVVYEKKDQPFWIIFFLNIIAAVACSFCYNIINNWLPVILREDFQINQSYVYLLMIVVVIVALVGNALAKPFSRVSKNYPLMQGAMYLLVAGFAIFLGLFGNNQRQILFLLCSFAVLMFSYTAAAFVTSVMAMRCRNYISAGAYFAVMNAGCSAGVCVCDYGIGSALDASPWQTVYKIIFIVGIAMAMTMLVSAYNFKKLKE